MSEDLANLNYAPIRDYKYAQWFDEVQYNGKTLSDSERKELVAVIDDTVARFSEGLPLMHETLESDKDLHDDYHEINRVVVSVLLFALQTMIDSMVASKYFILADKDYDRRFIRGKLQVILNEGFKRLYGFDPKTYKKSEWDRLLPLMGRFSEKINHQYQELTFLLERHSKSSSWWKNERDNETHLIADELYVSRQKELIESKVMMDSVKLFSTLQAVSNFLWNLHSCLYNLLVTKYRQGELIE